MKLFLLQRNWWSEEEDDELKKKEKEIILKALEETIHKPKASVSEMFTDVYCDMPPHILKQKSELEQHIAKYPDYYKH